MSKGEQFSPIDCPTDFKWYKHPEDYGINHAILNGGLKFFRVDLGDYTSGIVHVKESPSFSSQTIKTIKKELRKLDFVLTTRETRCHFIFIINIPIYHLFSAGHSLKVESSSGVTLSLLNIPTLNDDINYQECHSTNTSSNVSSMETFCTCQDVSSLTNSTRVVSLCCHSPSKKIPLITDSDYRIDIGDICNNNNNNDRTNKNCTISKIAFSPEKMRNVTDLISRWSSHSETQYGTECLTANSIKYDLNNYDTSSRADHLVDHCLSMITYTDDVIENIDTIPDVRIKL